VREPREQLGVAQWRGCGAGESFSKYVQWGFGAGRISPLLDMALDLTPLSGSVRSSLTVPVIEVLGRALTGRAQFFDGCTSPLWSPSRHLAADLKVRKQVLRAGSCWRTAASVAEILKAVPPLHPFKGWGSAISILAEEGSGARHACHTLSRMDEIGVVVDRSLADARSRSIHTAWRSDVSTGERQLRVSRDQKHAALRPPDSRIASHRSPIHIEHGATTWN
jgi:hypothetical protein